MLLTLAALPGCGKHSQATEARSKDASSPAVTTVQPQRRTFVRTIEQPGWIEAYETAPLFTKISGYVEKVHVELGAKVRKNDILAELSVPEMDEELKQKEALVAQAKTAIKQAEKSFAVTAASYETAKALVLEARAGVKQAQADLERWQMQHTRFTKLISSKAIDMQIGDETLRQFKSAEAAQELAAAKIQSAEREQDRSEANRDKAAADIEAAKDRLAVAQAEYRYMAALLQYAKVRAPFDGIVSQRHVDTGHFLKPGVLLQPSYTTKYDSERANDSEPLFVVVRTDPVRVFLDVPEADAVLVQKDATARVRVQGLYDREFVGKVAGVSWALLPGQRTLRTEIDFPNPKGELRPGMYAFATISVERQDVLVLPASAILTRDGQCFCFCVDNNKAIRTVIQIGARQGAWVEVLRKQRKAPDPEGRRWQDFSGEEHVISTRPEQLIDGQLLAVADRK